HVGLGKERIAVGAEQRAPGSAFEQELVGARAAALEVDASVLEAEGTDQAVAVEVDVRAEQRWTLRVRHGSEEDRVEFGRYLPFSVEVGDVDLHPAGGVVTGVGRKIGITVHGGLLCIARMVRPRLSTLRVCDLYKGYLYSGRVLSSRHAAARLDLPALEAHEH